MTGRIKAAIIGSGNIGTDLMVKIMRHSDVLEMAAFVGIDPASDGLARAARLGVAHGRNNAACAAAGKVMVDLTPAAIGPYVVPVVNGDAHLTAQNVNMVTCGGQATIPIVAAVSEIATVHYAEIVASIASRSAGPGTRANIDEFTETPSLAIERVGQGDHHPQPRRAADDDAGYGDGAVVRRGRGGDRRLGRDHGRARQHLCARLPVETAGPV